MSRLTVASSSASSARGVARGSHRLVILDVAALKRPIAVACLLLGSQFAWADAVDDIVARAGRRLSHDAAPTLRAQWVPHQDPCRPVGSIGGTWWAAAYQDGFEIYNCFRKCRGTHETASYFLGLSRGDCDSWYFDPRRNRRHVCLPRDVDALVRIHGPIISVEPRGPCNE